MVIAVWANQEGCNHLDQVQGKAKDQSTAQIHRLQASKISGDKIPGIGL